jgi:hypothetical protein
MGASLEQRTISGEGAMGVLEVAERPKAGLLPLLPLLPGATSFGGGHPIVEAGQ